MRHRVSTTVLLPVHVHTEVEAGSRAEALVAADSVPLDGWERGEVESGDAELDLDDAHVVRVDGYGNVPRDDGGAS